MDDLSVLCRACGFCCDGSLFNRVELLPEEVEPARKNRLHVLDGGRAFEQPCAALTPCGDGQRTCAVYDERPSSCRRFTCRLFERQRRDGGPLAPRLEAVRRVRVLVAELEARGLTPADFDGPGPEAAARAAFDELIRRLEDDFARG